MAVFPLKNYVERGQLSTDHFEVLTQAILARRNILVIGGTGSGKTTFLNALIREMVRHFPDDRCAILEDTKEIKCSAQNVFDYQTKPPEWTMTHLLAATLRMFPDRIFVGETRGPEALDLLDAWNTGHPGGGATIHANSAKDGLLRLEMLISRHPSAPRDIKTLIGMAVDVALFIQNSPTEGRRVTEVVAVNGYEDSRFQLKQL